MKEYSPVIVPTVRYELGIVPAAIIIVGVLVFKPSLLSIPSLLFLLSLMIIGTILAVLGQKALIHRERIEIYTDNVSYSGHNIFKRSSVEYSCIANFYIAKLEQDQHSSGIKPNNRLRTFVLYILFGMMSTISLFKTEQLVLVDKNNQQIDTIHLTYFDNEQKQEIVTELHEKLLR